MGMAKAIPLTCCFDAFPEVQAEEKEVLYESTVVTETVLLLGCWPRRGQQQPGCRLLQLFLSFAFHFHRGRWTCKKLGKICSTVKGKRQLEGAELCALLMELERWVQGITVQYTDTAVQFVGTPFHVLGKLLGTAQSDRMFYRTWLWCCRPLSLIS